MFVTGVHHIKIWVTDLARSREWYEKVFDLELSMSFEDQDGVVRGMAFRVAGTDFEIALRENRQLAEALNDADPFALATTREGLDEWITHLDALGVAHSPVIRASRGYGLGFRDPDGVQIRLYATDPAVTAESGDRVRVPPVNL